MWRVNTIEFIIAIIVYIFFIFAALNKILPLMLGTYCVYGFFTGGVLGTLNALIAEVSGYSYRKDNVHLEGTMFSCSSLGVKIGGGIGSAIAGLLLQVGGFDGMAAQQTASALNMISFMYIFVPLICVIGLAILFYSLKVEKANQDWDLKHNV